MDITMPVKQTKRTPIQARKPVIKLLGLGGAGSNAINRMLELLPIQITRHFSTVNLM